MGSGTIASEGFMRRVLLIRPQHDAFSVAEALESKGIKACSYPLFEPIFLPLPTLKNPQALIITSKNALRSLEGHEEFKKITLYVVGDQTAHLACQMGFSKIKNADLPGG